MSQERRELVVVNPAPVATTRASTRLVLGSFSPLLSVARTA
jgi:hypothetical protein